VIVAATDGRRLIPGAPTRTLIPPPDRPRTATDATCRLCRRRGPRPPGRVRP